MMVKFMMLIALIYSASTNAQEVWRWVSQPGVDLGFIPNSEIKSLKVSSKGRFLTFTSRASNLVANDTNYQVDLFILDTIYNEIQRVNVTSDGQQAIDSEVIDFSQATDNGRYVAFTTRALNFPQANGDTLLYVKDLVTGALTLESKNSSGTAFSLSSASDLFLSNDASSLFFATSTSLVAADNNIKTDVYRKNLFDFSTFDLISVSSSGGVSDDDVYLVNVSDNLRYVVLNSKADDLVAPPNYSSYNTYLRDLNSATTVFVNVTENGAPSTSGESSFSGIVAAVNNQGQVIHCSSASDLIDNDNNGLKDIFLFDSGRNYRIVSQANGQEITDQSCGYSQATITVSNSDNSFTFSHRSEQLTAQDNNQFSDVFRYDLNNQQVELISFNVALDTSNGASTKAVMGGESSNVYFLSEASDLTQQRINSIHPLLYQYNDDNQQLSFINETVSPVNSLVSNVTTPLISQDQTQLVFASLANNITSDAERSGIDAFHLNLLTNERQRIATKLANTSVYGGNNSDLGIHSAEIDFSPNGRYVVFTSQYFQPIDTIDLIDDYVFMYDLTTGQYTQIAIGENPKVNNDGKVVFDSGEDDLVVNDNNNTTDIFLFDPDNQSISRVSTRIGAAESNGYSGSPDIGGEGPDTWITFSSGADNLITGDVNGKSDVFLTHWLSGSFIRVSENNSGVGGDNPSSDAVISDDGQSVAFLSRAKNLSNHSYPPENYWYQLFAYDRMTDEVELISLQSNGLPAAEGVFTSSFGISSSGQFLAFVSDGDNFVANDFNEIQDLFLIDRENQSTIRLSVNLNGEELSQARYGFSPHLVEDVSVSPPTLGVAFAGHPQMLDDVNFPGYREAFLYQQGGPGVSLNTQVKGQGQVSGSLAYNCGANATCSNTYPLGTTLQLVAAPSAGHVFVGWSGDSCAGSTQNPCVHFMDQEKDIKVTFVSQQDLIFFDHFED